MKKTLLMIMILLNTTASVSAIDLEARAGFGYLGYSGNWEAHLGTLIPFKVLDKFYFRPGILLDWDSGSNDLFKVNGGKLGMSMPLFASYSLPVNRNINIRMNLGPFVGRASKQFNVGTAFEAGLEFKKFYTGVFWFKDFVGEDYSRVNVSIGYKFTLSQ